MAYSMAWSRAALAAASGLALVALFHQSGPHEFGWLLLEAISCALFTVLARLSFPGIALRLLSPAVILCVAFVQCLQFLPAVPGDPSWMDLAVSATGVLSALLAVFLVRFAIIAHEFRSEKL